MWAKALRKACRWTPAPVWQRPARRAPPRSIAPPPCPGAAFGRAHAARCGGRGSCRCLCAGACAPPAALVRVTAANGARAWRHASPMELLDEVLNRLQRRAGPEPDLLLQPCRVDREAVAQPRHRLRRETPEPEPPADSQSRREQGTRDGEGHLARQPQEAA